MRGVLVYVTINTLIYNEEIDDLLAYTDFLVGAGVDALIIQDLGVLDLCLNRYPDTDIHVSTQMNTHSINQVKFLKSLGVKRIVLARETAIDLIKQIKQEVDIEIEVFVHGALCVSYSGQCLMSSMMGGRSGNRGECAQPCRLPYALLKDGETISEESYLLSTKDLMTIEYMHALIDAGIDSFKIEGRMRKAYYVIQAVLSYKKARDAYLNHQTIDLESDIASLTKLFNRSFTKGYLLHEKPKAINQNMRPNHMGIEVGEVISYYNNQVKVKLKDTLKMHDGYRIISKNKDYGNIITRLIKQGELVKEAHAQDIVMIDVKERIEKGAILLKTLDVSLEHELSTYIDENFPIIPLVGTCIIKHHEPIQFIIKDRNDTYTIMSNDRIEEARTQSTSKAQVLEKLSRLGETPFYFESLEILMSDYLFIPVKVMNQLRRDAIHLILEKRKSRKVKRIVSYVPSMDQNDEIQEPMLVIKARTEAQYQAAILSGIKDIYVDYRLNLKEANLYQAYPNIEHQVRDMSQKSLIAETGSLFKSKHVLPFILDHHLNVTNIYTARLLKTFHPVAITLSTELSKEHLKVFYESYVSTFHKHIALEYMVYGRSELMTTKYCPIAKTFNTQENCHLCERNQYALKTHKGLVLPLVHNGHCELNILQDKPIHLISYVRDIISFGIQRLRLDFTVESFDETKKVIADFQKALTKEHILKPTIPFHEGRYLG